MESKINDCKQFASNLYAGGDDAEEACGTESVQGDTSPSLQRNTAEERRQMGLRSPRADPPAPHLARDLSHGGDGSACTTWRLMLCAGDPRV
ncbi:hypothetical protein Bca52824_062596 [Brassica carinata]|uniref:Uncharacterized protein n=1 Tax=Brassica carinata TaxID=52824 RepID=A0A8X7U9K0_BRACI|nr:hypothetical protein Bca52824_062596 [Brassica carinata]